MPLNSKIKFNEKNEKIDLQRSQEISIRQAQDKQDEIFKKMSVKDKLRMLDEFFRFAKQLQTLNDRRKNKP